MTDSAFPWCGACEASRPAPSKCRRRRGVSAKGATCSCRWCCGFRGRTGWAAGGRGWPSLFVTQAPGSRLTSPGPGLPHLRGPFLTWFPRCPEPAAAAAGAREPGSGVTSGREGVRAPISHPSAELGCLEAGVLDPLRPEEGAEGAQVQTEGCPLVEGMEHCSPTCEPTWPSSQNRASPAARLAAPSLAWAGPGGPVSIQTPVNGAQCGHLSRGL